MSTKKKVVNREDTLVVDFMTEKAGVNVNIFEKKNKSIMILWEPSLPAVLELIKLGSGVKSEVDAMKIYLREIRAGKTLMDISEELIRASAIYTLGGVALAEKAIEEIKSRLEDGLSAIEGIGLAEDEGVKPEVAQTSEEKQVEEPVTFDEDDSDTL